MVKQHTALRAVQPYYHNDKLIGYLEVAQEIDSFFQVMSNEKYSDYALIVKKSYLNHQDWLSATKSDIFEMGQDWNTYKDFLLLKSFENKSSKFSDNLFNISKKGKIIGEVKINDKYYLKRSLSHIRRFRKQIRRCCLFNGCF
ncbi:MAG: hypothetical protein MZU95_04115 [Desulfomicrobium escambiense]|nr:hypothetical protein [Desulfomicrobium escambiense]